MSTIEFKDIKKQYGKTVVMEDMNLNIKEGSFTVLVGPSGCGKTTLLRMLAGLEEPTSGKIFIDGKDVTKVSSGKRDIAMVFQNYALYPTMTVKGNIEFGLKNIKIPKEERESLISDVSVQVGLEGFLDRKVSDLSGGQRQRVALARAMVKKPAIFLMDEPLSNLDAKLRVQMRTKLIELHQQLGATFVYVTHDQVEAMAMASEVVLMSQGAVMQKGTPENLYVHPENKFSAEFIGSPSMNVIEEKEEHVFVGFRPEKVCLCNAAGSSSSGSEKITAEIITREMLGSETIYQVGTTQGNIQIKIPDSSYHVHEKVGLELKMKDVFVFDGDGTALECSEKEKERLVHHLLRRGEQ